MQSLIKSAGPAPDLVGAINNDQTKPLYLGQNLNARSLDNLNARSLDIHI